MSTHKEKDDQIKALKQQIREKDTMIDILKEQVPGKVQSGGPESYAYTIPFLVKEKDKKRYLVTAKINLAMDKIVVTEKKDMPSFSTAVGKAKIAYAKEVLEKAR